MFPRSIYIAFDVFPAAKGSSSHIASMVTALARRHAPVWLICCGYGEMPAHQVESDVEIFRHTIFHPNLLKRAREFQRFVAEVLLRAGGSVDACVFRDPWGGVPALDWHLSRPGMIPGQTPGPGIIPGLLDCRMIFEVNALPRWELPYAYSDFSENHALRAKIEDSERYCLFGCDSILTVSEVNRESLIALGVPPEKIAVVPNAAFETFFHARQGVATPCPLLPCLNEDQWFGYVGSLHPWQGLDVLIDAYALVAEDLPDTRLLIVHNGRHEPLRLLRKRIQKRGVGDRVVLHDPLPPDELAAVLAGLAFTVAPIRETARNTVQGCCPVKIIESMAAGTPVIASDLRVCRELVCHEQDGLLVAPDDPAAWARAIRRLATEPGLAARLGQAAREKARNVFSWEKSHAILDAHWTFPNGNLGTSDGKREERP